MTEPWEGAHWSVSPHNFAAEIAIPPRPVQLHDVTLRDGEEIFLDEMTVAELEVALGRPVLVVERTPAAAAKALLEGAAGVRHVRHGNV